MPITAMLGNNWLSNWLSSQTRNGIKRNFKPAFLSYQVERKTCLVLVTYQVLYIIQHPSVQIDFV